MKKVIISALILFLLPIISYSAELTPEYLEGKWCFTHIDMGEEQEAENKNWEFRKDGTLSYQVSSNSSKMNEGKYEIDGDTLRLKPVFITDLKILSADENEFVFKFFGEVHFLRGECE